MEGLEVTKVAATARQKEWKIISITIKTSIQSQTQNYQVRTMVNLFDRNLSASEQQVLQTETSIAIVSATILKEEIIANVESVIRNLRNENIRVETSRILSASSAPNRLLPEKNLMLYTIENRTPIL